MGKDFDEEGVEFSGGEGQKLVTARAYYKNAPMEISVPLYRITPSVGSYRRQSSLINVVLPAPFIYFHHPL